MASNSTTLHISDTSIRLMVTRGKRISKLADMPLEYGLPDIDDEAKEAEFASRIKQLFKRNKISAKKIIVGISGLHCISRPAVLPQLPKALLDEAFLREAKRVFPVPPEQLYISWQITSSTESAINAFMIAIPRSIADTLIRVLNQVGVKPYLMDLKPLAISRLIKEATAIAVDIQTREFDIVILSDGIPQPIRTVTFPDEALSVAEKLSVVKAELKRTVQFYNSNNPERPLPFETVMYISGELSDEPGLYETLSTELGFHAEALTSPLKCQKQLDPTLYLVNVGLALKELPKESGSLLPNINTLPTPYLPKQIPVSRLIAIPATAVAVGLVILLAVTIQNAGASIASTQSQLDAATYLLEKKQTTSKEMTATVEAMNAELAAMESTRKKFTAAFDMINAQCTQINDDLVVTVSNMVDDFSLGTINHAGGTLQLTGRAQSELEVFEYVRNMLATERFSEITISNLTRTEISDNASGMVFSISVRLKGNE